MIPQMSGIRTIIDKYILWIKGEMDICRKGNGDPLKIEDKSLITYKEKLQEDVTWI